MRSSSITYPRVRVQRRKNGRLWKVLIEDEDGTTIDIPVQRIGYEHGAHDLGTVTLAVGSHRVEFETISEKDAGY